jgi:tripartite-type tricarboxylate transporter receptor subunit TctC
LGVTTSEQSSVAPDLPTIAGSGLPGFESSTSTGLLFPAGTPQAIVDKVNAALIKTLKQPEVRKSLQSLGADVAPGTEQDFAATMRNEIAKWTKVVHDANIKVE